MFTELPFWLLAYRTGETQFIFNLFHLLLAGLTLLVLLYQFAVAHRHGFEPAGWFLPLGFFLLVLHFGLLASFYGAGFFFHTNWNQTEIDRFTHALMAGGYLMAVAASVKVRRQPSQPLVRWMVIGSVAVVGTLLLGAFLWPGPLNAGEKPHSLAMLLTDIAAVLGLGTGLFITTASGADGQRPVFVGFATATLVFLLHLTQLFVTPPMQLLVWNAEEHLLSVSLFAFAWAAGERSENLFDRIFVRLNLAFIILASLLMLITTGMEKRQYLRLAEERSMNLAEFLRGHIVYYHAQGESLEDIFRRPEVLKRVVVEFGTLPELLEVSIHLDRQRASFSRAENWAINEEIVLLTEPWSFETDAKPANSFQMIRLPIGSGTDHRNRVEFLGTMNYINSYIGEYIAVTYSLFTIVVLLATGIVGFIVTDTDRRLQRQYAELEASHQQLAQSAKLASIGQLAAGVAHEINNPITSILSLTSHLTEGKTATPIGPRHRKSLQLIVQQAERVSQIVRNLLVFARQSYLELSRVDVGEVVDAAATLVGYRTKNSAISIQREIEVGLPKVLGDHGRLTEVLVNLFNNAIDAMPGGGTLIIRASGTPEPDGGVRIEVQDTGTGIQPEHLPRIFDPFFTTKEPGQGTGLGLSISHGIVKDHGGQIWAESWPGSGTTVVVILSKEVSENESADPGHRR